LEKVGELDPGIAGVLTRLTQRNVQLWVKNGKTAKMEYIFVKHDKAI
jgi:hypothetical protein